ncbi:MAG TPA: O-antigen ligase family protein [Polyangiaceae bacterium]|nr:O-antigen ligase family protein [Polyangiaceae bacterium]
MRTLLPRPAGDAARRAPPRPRAPRLAVAVLLVLAFAVLALGCLYPLAACALGLASAALAAWALGREGPEASAPPPVVWPFVAGAAVCLLQSIPLPLRLLAALAPPNADVWARALAPLGGPPPAFAPASLAPELTRVEAVKWLSYAALAWAGALWARRYRLESVAQVVLGLAFAVGLITVAHGALGLQAVYGFYEPRITFPRWRIGPLLNANHLSGYLNLGVFAGLGLLLTARRRRTARTALLLVATCGLIMGVVLLASRAAVLLLVLGAVASLPLARGRGRGPGGPNAALWVVGLLVTGVLLALFGYRETVVNDLRDKDITKLFVARDALALARNHWLLGVGRGAFEGAFFAYKKVPGDLTWTHPENIAVQWASEWGLPASLAVAALFARAFVRAGAWRSRTLGRLLALALAVLVLHNFADFSLEVAGVAALAAFVAGALTGRESPDGRRHRHAARPGAPAGDRAGPRRALAAWALPAPLAALSLASAAAQPALLSELRRSAFDLARGGPDDTSFGQLRGFMLRFPAEPYFPLVGGLLAVKRRAGEGLPWFNRALERAPQVGAVHLALADVLSAVRLRSQALLEVRLAAESDPLLAGHAARFAARLGGPADDLLEALPAEHAAYPRYLEGLLTFLPPESDVAPAARAALLERQPCSLVARQAEARARLREAGDPAGECADERARDRCRARVEDELSRLALCPGGAEPAAMLHADWVWARGDKPAALAELDALCTRLSGSVTPCLERLAERSAEAHDVERMNRAMRAVSARRCTGAEACATAWGWAAEVHLRNGDPASAFAAAGRAVDSNPADLRQRRTYAEIALRIGAFERAARAYEYIVERSPHDAAARARLAHIRQRMAAEPARPLPLPGPARAPAAPDPAPSAPPSPPRPSTALPWRPPPPRAQPR